MLELTTQMVRAAGRIINPELQFSYKGQKFSLAEEPEIITVADAFLKYTSKTSEEADIDGDFDELMVCNIEPNLGRGHLTFLIDYPSNRASLSRLKKSNPQVAERFELYIEGMELANAFGELLDPAEQRSRFALANDIRKANGIAVYPEREDFFAALEAGLPPVSGSALGLDRLAMIFAGTDDISDVKTF